ncbi:MAG TPA: hypothetical protein VIP98_10540 [Microlunatus sp.]
MMTWKRLDWATIYGADWRRGSADLARYFGKQFGCMLASQRLPIPRDLIPFLDGAERCPSWCFMVAINWRGGDCHRMMRRHGFADGLSNFIGIIDSAAYQSQGSLSGFTYTYHIGYVWICADWHDGMDRQSWFEHPSIELMSINGTVGERIAWMPRRPASEGRYLWNRVRKVHPE